MPTKKTPPTPKAEDSTKLTVLHGEGKGQTIEQMAEMGEVIDPIPEPITGSQPQMSFTITDEHAVILSSLKAKLPTKLPVTGQFQPGDEFKLEITLRVNDIHHDAVCDRYGNKRGMERTHIAAMAGYSISRK